MIKRMYLKKIMVCFIALFTILLLYIVPNKQEKLKIKEELEYVDLDIKTSSIYLLDSNNYLAKSEVITKGKNNLNKARELIETLIIDGKNQDRIPNGFKAVIPSGTEIRSLTLNDNLIKVDFTDELMNTSIENEEKIIEAIVYTLTSLDNVDFIIIYMEGNILTTLPQSRITLPSTLDRSFGINKEYNINKPNNISKTTIYYISTFNDNEYYIPVTKINNDNRKKIEIIIDELSSSNVYKTNLMSYLNSNAKLLSVNETDDKIVLNFNEAIFNDINTKEILEEVIYTISMSVDANYDINTVVFNVNDEEIYESVLKTIE